MAAKTTGLDTFSNMASISIAETAANTLAYKKLEVGLSTFDKVAWVIHRLEYYMVSAHSLFNGSGDAALAGLAVQNVRTSAILQNTAPDPAFLDTVALTRVDLGAAASGFFDKQPIVKDFAALPSGGILVPPSPIYGFAQGVGLTDVSSWVIRIFYTLRELSESDYWQLMETRRILTA